jgi:hypothetical protein
VSGAERARGGRERLLVGALVFTFLAHGAAMLGMLAFLLPLVPGGGGSGSDVDRVLRIAASPLSYRVGWLGWQITALSDVVLAVALVRAHEVGVARRAALVQLVLVLLAVVPDQGAQLMLVTRGIELARAAAASGDASPFLAFEERMFPLTSGWAALLYTLAAIGWAVTLRAGGRWSRALATLSPPMLLLFVAISVAPILPEGVRPKSELIGAGNALGFALLEGWFVAALLAVRATSRR